MKSSHEPWILGMSSSHNGAVCLLRGNEIACAVQEERLLRYKRAEHPAADESLAIQYCLKSAGIEPADLSAVVVCTTWPADRWRDDPSHNPSLRTVRNKIQTFTIPHHLGHAVGAFANSGFRESAILVVDGNGSPWQDLTDAERSIVPSQQYARHSAPGLSPVREIISLYTARDCRIVPVQKHVSTVSLKPKPGMQRFGTLGDMYGFVGRQIFGSFFEGPGKVMGLAPYGRPTIPTTDFFDVVDNEFFFKDRVPECYPHDEHWPNHKEEYCNLAAAVQAALEAGLHHLLLQMRSLSTSHNLCYAGGVALNSVANEKLIRENLFNDIFIMPAAEDSGTAIGAAFYGLWQLTNQNKYSRIKNDSVGRRYSADEVSAAISNTPGICVRDTTNLIEDITELLIDGQIVGWFQGGSELGPRALGQRSILCDPRSPTMKDKLNSRVKFREAFRPFAPIILLEHTHEWVDVTTESVASPFMLRVMQFRPEKAAEAPAVVHVDGTGRVQTLTESANGRLHRLLRRFYQRTGVPILLNTSFNIAGEPIVETPEDALWCFQYTEMDVCVLEDRIVYKRPGVHPLLDNVVVLTATAISLDCAINESGVSYSNDLSLPVTLPRVYSAHAASRVAEAHIRSHYSGFKIRFQVNTRWGPAKHIIDRNVLPVLAKIDGKKTGRQILSELQDKYPQITDRDFIALMGVLRRVSAISLRECDVITEHDRDWKRMANVPRRGDAKELIS